MVFTDKSGGWLDQSNYAASVANMELGLQQAYTKNFVHNTLTQAQSVAEDVGYAAKFDFGGGLVKAGQRGVEEGLRNLEYDQYVDRYLQQRATDEMQFQVSQLINVPDVKFSIDPQLFSEITGNGFSVYRVVYDDRDIARIDKILTAFGYKYCKVLEASDFSNRKYFNYVRASVSVGGLPRWFADGISRQIANGVRVWHVKPDPLHYSNNPLP